MFLSQRGDLIRKPHSDDIFVETKYKRHSSTVGAAFSMPSLGLTFAKASAGRCTPLITVACDCGAEICVSWEVDYSFTNSLRMACRTRSGMSKARVISSQMSIVWVTS